MNKELRLIIVCRSVNMIKVETELKVLVTACAKGLNQSFLLIPRRAQQMICWWGKSWSRSPVKFGCYNAEVDRACGIRLCPRSRVAEEWCLPQRAANGRTIRWNPAWCGSGARWLRDSAALAPPASSQPRQGTGCAQSRCYQKASAAGTSCACQARWALIQWARRLPCWQMLAVLMCLARC